MRNMVKLVKRSDALRAAGRKGEHYLLHCVETIHDLRYNIHTRSDDLNPAFRDDEGYDPISYPGLDFIRKRVGFRAGEVFVDIGCGRGRALCVFSRDPVVARCVGIEYHAGHVETARRNARNVRARRALIEVIQGDAAEQHYDGATLILLFNPFGETTMRKTMQSIEASLRRTPRPLRVLYVNPKYDKVLDEQPWLAKIAAFQIPNRIHRSLPSSLWHSQDTPLTAGSSARTGIATSVA